MRGNLRSPEERAAFAHWLGTRSDIRATEPEEVSVAAPASGWSNETIIADISRHRVVVRMAPARLSMFPDYDLDKEWRIIRVLHRRGRPPVARPIAEDLGGTLFGRPFFVMSFVDGITPSDNKPTYAERGWLVEADVPRRQQFWDGFMAAMVAVHETDWRASDLSRLAPPAGTSSLAAAVDWLQVLYRWSDAPQPEIERAFRRLKQTMPDDPGNDVLLWGDARPANVLVRDFGIAALLDWELATVGPPEMDVAWFQEMHWMRTVGSGVALPEGFPDDSRIAATCEGLTGRALTEPVWYRLLAATKVAVLLYRHLVVAIDRGAMPAGHPLLTDNIATRRLAALLA
ncbi:MAG: phosphotransferase family protein [Minwuia sp.]|nr:phosphotransferase family protein [Minwuia sp.]